MRFDAHCHWLAARGEGASSTCRPRTGGPASGRRGTSRGAQALARRRGVGVGKLTAPAPVGLQHAAPVWALGIQYYTP